MAEIRFAESDEEILRCYPIIAQLRPRISEDDFLDQVIKQQEDHDYRLVYLEDAGDIKTVAGYRVCVNLAWGRHLYVDDLITDEHARGKGFAGQLMDWLLEEAVQSECQQVHLDSGVHRHEAHRFYMSRGMIISSHHFSLTLTD